MKSIMFLSTLISMLPMLSEAQNSVFIIEGDSQVNCYDFNPDFYIADTMNNPGGAYWIAFDLNNDLINDLKFNVEAFHPLYGSTSGSADLFLMDSNIQVVCDREFYPWPDTLVAGDTLQNEMSANVWTSLVQYPDHPFNLRYIINGNGGLGGTGLWQHPITHFMGFRYILNSDTLYGYFELKVEVLAGVAHMWVDKVCYQGNLNTITSINNTAVPTFDFDVAPNPVQSLLSISTSSSRELVVVLSDVFGRKLISFSFLGKQEIDFSFLPPGLYFITAGPKENKQLITRKIIKE